MFPVAHRCSPPGPDVPCSFELASTSSSAILLASWQTESCASAWWNRPGSLLLLLPVALRPSGLLRLTSELHTSVGKLELSSVKTSEPTSSTTERGSLSQLQNLCLGATSGKPSCLFKPQPSDAVVLLWDFPFLGCLLLIFLMACCRLGCWTSSSA